MKIGSAFPTTEVGNDPAVIRDYVQAVEALGYDHLTCIDHVIQGESPPPGDEWMAYYTRANPFHEAMVLLGFVAGATTRLGLATAILILPQRQAVLAAKQFAELDVLCGGRLRAGVGIGWNALEFDALGETFRGRAARMEEQIALLRALWTNDTVRFAGEWHRVEDAGLNPLPVQRPIPVWIGAFRPAAIRRAGRLADGWFVNPRIEPAAAEAQIEVFREAAAGAGRDPASLGIDATLHVGERDDEALAKEACAWAALGATHLTVRTIYSGLDGAEAHIAALERVRAVLPAG